MRRRHLNAALLLALLWPSWSEAQSWTAPRTYVTGELITAAILNTHVRDNLTVLRAGGFAVTSQAIGDLLCASSTTQFARLADVATGQVLTSGGVGACPAYSGSPTLSGTLTAAAVVGNGTTQLTYKVLLSGQVFLSPATSSADGLALVLGVNRSANRQLWIGDSALLAVNSSNTVIRFQPNATTIDAIATDATAKNLTLGAASDAGGVLAYLKNGAVGTPGLTFGSDTDLGLYRVTTDTLGITTAGTLRAKWSAGGLFMTGGGTPTLSSCGTSPAITGTDNAGKIDTDNTATCTVTFSETWSNAPSCTLTLEAGGSASVLFADGSGPTTTGFTVVVGAVNTDEIYYVCIGKP